MSFKKMLVMKPVKLAWVIHIFALLHALVALGCRFAGVGDELLLTVLTMALALIICKKKGLSIEFTAAIVIVMNILGYFLGTFGADLLGKVITAGYAVNSVATAITTEILGWSVVLMTGFFSKEPKTDKTDTPSSTYLRWLLLVAGGIFVTRLLLVAIFANGHLDDEGIFLMARKVLGKPVPLTILICVNILYVRYIASKNIVPGKWLAILVFAVFTVFSTLLEVFLVGDSGDFPMILAVGLVIQVTIYCIVYMVNYAITVSGEMQLEREKATMAQYRYLKLKRQVNPHFLFNSLNILDCLICEEKTEQASIYTHKLAGIYRYMIKSEEEEVVSLRDELVFVRLYIDLLKVRFPEGFEVEINVDEEMMARFVPPCSIQLLIENATKHNAVSAENPLVVKVETKDGCVQVSNNIVPKVTRSSSTGLGQKYISQLYADLSGKNVEIVKTDTDYCVTLPLL